MKIIGLTGQTGAGKSTVCKALEKEGYFHIDADRVYKSLLTPGSELIGKLESAFGGDIVLPDGTLDRKALSKKAFKTPRTASLLSEVTHPAVIEKINEIIREKEAENVKGVLIDAIGLFESGASELCDFTVSVTAPEEMRLQRITQRDNISVEEALLRINAQKDEEFFVKNADIVIRNFPPHDLESEIKRITEYGQK